MCDSLSNVNERTAGGAAGGMQHSLSVFLYKSTGRLIDNIVFCAGCLMNLCFHTIYNFKTKCFTFVGAQFDNHFCRLTNVFLIVKIYFKRDKIM